MKITKQSAGGWTCSKSHLSPREQRHKSCCLFSSRFSWQPRQDVTAAKGWGCCLGIYSPVLRGRHQRFPRTTEKDKNQKTNAVGHYLLPPSSRLSIPPAQPRTDGAQPLAGLPRDGTPQSCVRGTRNGGVASRGGAGGGCGGDARVAGPLFRSRGRGRVRLGPPEGAAPARGAGPGGCPPGEDGGGRPGAVRAAGRDVSAGGQRKEGEGGSGF